MGAISGEDFEKIIYSDFRDNLLADYVVEIKKILNINLDKVYMKTSFSNITFKGNSLRFYRQNQDQIHLIDFIDCKFLCDLNFDNCNLNELKFNSNLFNCNHFKINGSKILNLSVKGNNIFEKGNLEIQNCEFESSFDVENLKFVDFSSLNIRNSTFNCSSSIIRCEINQILFSHNYFKNHFDYFGNSFNYINNSALFNYCEFNYSSFFETKFNNETRFVDCKFFNVTKFESVGDEIKTKLKFDDCEFLSQVSFNNSRIHKILFSNVKFNDIVSLQETYFDIINIDRTIFEKQANFDDIQIKNIDRCDRRTIRTIKLQLQKAENKIDLHRFRVYEFNAYQEDIKQKLISFKKDENRFYHRKREPIQLKRDLFILRISEFVSEYGTDWKRALKFTLFAGLIFYSILYRIENSGTLNLEKINEFLVGLFRFFLVTDFYNPLETDRNYLINPLSWFIFILGKIFIAFGIYEMIQSFRKFKA